MRDNYFLETSYKFSLFSKISKTKPQYVENNNN